MSLLFNPFAVPSVLVVISGISWFIAMARDGQYARRLGGVFVPCMVAVIVGVLLGSLTTFAGVVRLLA